ncbi:molybdopterin cofactor-binding domain-containing protein [Tenuifilum sp.]|jgi:xanthine dehydrogenase large subunit|uniref:xanthine dehydrogenase molybdopterin binding subunit n=1 Tax=Tenuifilum sp. TaxID=2760880 RepID=UPI00258CE08D|nr:molybdopterin cofactor-binding domain-containing protein [Tenuifilum sp.]
MMKNIDTIGHVTGKSVYLDDIPTIAGTLHAAIVGSVLAHAKIININFDEAAKIDGVEKIILHSDIPGENQIGGIIDDETLLAEHEVHYQGQPIAIVVAKTERIARKAASLVKIDYKQLEPVTDPREAKEKGLLLIPPRTFRMGNTDSAWSNCKYIIEDRVDIGGQEHLYIETQGAYAYNVEGGYIKVHSSTQGPTAVQKTISRILGIPMHMVEVDVVRLGGGFGGKEDQASGFAAMAALATYVTGKPVKLVLPRHDDMRMTGKRHPYSADFKIGLSDDLKIVAFETTMYQNGGAAADLSPAIMERTLFHSTGSYFIPNTRVTVYSCKTNLPPNTAFRGFGGPQGMFVIESAIAKAAEQIGVNTIEIQKANLLNESDEFQYGQKAENVNARKSFELAYEKFDFENLKKSVENYNKINKFSKRGMAVMPLCFGISFTNTSMNQARALVHIYQDGSVSVSTGAIEMGQGVNTKLAQVASIVLGIDIKRIKVHSTNTSRVANTSPTAASSGADLNGNAVRIATSALKKRLIKVAAEELGFNEDELNIENEVITHNGNPTQLHWQNLVKTAHLKRVALSENGHYATPIIHFDKTKEKGHPFAYHVYGTAIITSTVDCIRGTYTIDDVHIVHDFGNSINPTIDLGQVEGAVVQGIGWLTMEELAFDKKGKLLSNSLSTYKVPDIFFAPKSIECIPLPTEGPDLAVLRSKAIGEPPFMYGIAAYFAIQNAIKAFNPKHTLKFDSPLTPEKVLMQLYE